MVSFGEPDPSDPSDDPLSHERVAGTAESLATEKPPKVGKPWLAWLIILGIAATIVILRPAPSDDANDSPAARTELYVLEFEGKYLVGAANLPGMDGQVLYREAQRLNGGGLAHRLCFVILAGELAGPAEALEQLERVDAQLAGTEAKQRPDLLDVLAILRQMYTVAKDDDDAAVSTDGDRKLLIDELGWFGKLAVATVNRDDKAAREAALSPARQTMAGMLAAFGAATLAGIIGLAAFSAFVALALRGTLARRLDAGSPYGGVYAEAFAVWLLIALTLGIVVRWLSADDGLSIGMVIAMLGGLVALVWPVLRGVPAGQMCRDVGIVFGRKPLLELLWGWVGYLATLPLVLVGVIIFLVLLSLRDAFGAAGAGDEFGPTGLPSHPVIGWLAEGGWRERLLVIFLASVAAPIVEETMFRGLLYRQLRDSTAAWRVGWSIAFSATANSFIFAAIHPQGLIAIPPLMALAVGFSLLREWRGSLLAPMTAHATNNFIVTMLVISIA